MPETEKQPSYLHVFFVFIFALLYSVLRYHIFKGIGWDHLSLFTANKVFALTGVILITLAILTKSKPSEVLGSAQNKLYSRSGYFFISLHVLASLALLNRDYYPKFYNQAQMNLTGEMSMLLGIIAFYIYTITVFRSWIDAENCRDVDAVKRDLTYRYLTHFLVMGHLLVMGIGSWLIPSEWPGYMLPISFLSFLFLLFILPVSLQRNQS